jgi:hypothetical protein
LAHEWRPERIVVALSLTAYCDESGTHDGSPVTIMSAIMASAHQWQNFEREFAMLKLKYGFNTLHTKKFKRRAGDFKGWSRFKQLSLLNDLKMVCDSSAFSEAVIFTLEPIAKLGWRGELLGFEG